MLQGMTEVNRKDGMKPFSRHRSRVQPVSEIICVSKNNLRD